MELACKNSTTTMGAFHLHVSMLFELNSPITEMY